MQNPWLVLVILALLAPVIVLPFASPQATADSVLQGQLKRVFPNATSFSAKQPGPPPHFVAYMGEGNSKAVVGYAFWTTELELLERGYDGPIKILVGMDLKGILTGVQVVQHNEPYGNFSIEPPRFAAQFKGKDIRDPFEVGKDVDAVSSATITIKSSSRAIKNSARRIARALLAPPGAAK
jgi:NosR/NirI family nitrous oxide reductase transcriptional regulator